MFDQRLTSSIGLKGVPALPFIREPSPFSMALLIVGIFFMSGRYPGFPEQRLEYPDSHCKGASIHLR
jgi:hypothetical protein